MLPRFFHAAPKVIPASVDLHPQAQWLVVMVGATVDGWNLVNSPVEVGCWNPMIYRVLYILGVDLEDAFIFTPIRSREMIQFVKKKSGGLKPPTSNGSY